MRAEYVSIGTELLLGQITDTNATFLAQSLPTLGIDLYFGSVVGDNRARLTDTLRRASQRSDLVLCTGGLGPTEDDVTREAVSDLLGEPMVVQPDLEARLRGFFETRGQTMPVANLKQATLIASAQALPNPVGTAPGWWVEPANGAIIICMPGVPHEMRTMWQNEVVPRLRQRLPGEIILSTTLKVLGRGESAVEEMIRSLLASNNPTIGTYAKSDGIHLRLTAKAPTVEQAKDMLFELEMKLRGTLGTLIYGTDDESLEEVIGQQVLDRKETLAIVEVGTGGLSAILGAAPTSPQFLRGSLATQQRTALLTLGIAPDLFDAQPMISTATAESLAAAVATHFGATCGLALVVSAGPGEYEGTPPGHACLAVMLEGRTRSATLTYSSSPAEIRRLAELSALSMLRHALLQ